MKFEKPIYSTEDVKKAVIEFKTTKKTAKCIAAEYGISARSLFYGVKKYYDKETKSIKGTVKDKQKVNKQEANTVNKIDNDKKKNDQKPQKGGTSKDIFIADDEINSYFNIDHNEPKEKKNDPKIAREETLNKWKNIL